MRCLKCSQGNLQADPVEKGSLVCINCGWTTTIQDISKLREVQSDLGGKRSSYTPWDKLCIVEEIITGPKGTTAAICEREGINNIQTVDNWCRQRDLIHRQVINDFKKLGDVSEESEIEPSVSKNAEGIKDEDKGFILQLYMKAEQKAQEYAELLREKQRLEMRAARLKDYIEHMNIFLEAEGQDKIQI